MTGNLKVLGLALAALLAISAVAASAAQAETSLDVGANPAILTGEQTEQLKLKLTESGTTVKCTNATLEGTTAASNVTEVSLTPNYFEGEAGNCTLGGTNVTVTRNGCTIQLTIRSLFPLKWRLHITCSFGNEIKIDNGSCIIGIPPQGPLSEIVFENMAGPPKDVTANVAISGITYQGNSGCPANQQGLHHDGDLTGKTTIRAFADSSGVEGAQVSLEAT
jgi:hypothetical protein